jgi:polysaccharide biosynthesis protein PslH
LATEALGLNRHSYQEQQPRDYYTERDLRILFVSPYLPSLIRVRPFNFIRQLAERHEITVLSTDWASKISDRDRLLPYCQGVHLVPLRRSAIARSCLRAALMGDPLQAAFCRSLEFSGKLLELLETNRFDVAHVEHLRAAHLGEVIPRDLATLYDSVDSISLLLERTLESSHSGRQKLIAALELRRTRAYEAQVIRRFDRTIVTSPEDSRALRALAPEAPVSVVPNGVDLDYFRPLGIAHEPETLVFSGKMSYHANVTALLHFVRDIFPLIKRERPGVRLRVVGSGPPSSVIDLARDPAISVTGFIPDMREAIGRAAVALCPVTVKVGIQNKVLEAMAMGVPVVSTREGAQGIQAQAGRDLLVADSAEEFAVHVCRLLNDSGLHESVAMSGRRFVESNHRWDVAAGRLEDLYVEAIHRRRQGAIGSDRSAQVRIAAQG